jgi:cytochrome c556
LETVLPPRFKALDAVFHDRAGKLGSAAAAHNAKLVVAQYSRMLESCTVCHAEFAKSRFPNFASRSERAPSH